MYTFIDDVNALIITTVGYAETTLPICDRFT